MGIVLSLAVCFYLFKEIQTTNKKISRCENFQSTLAKHVNTLSIAPKPAAETEQEAVPDNEVIDTEEIVVKSKKNE